MQFSLTSSLHILDNNKSISAFQLLTQPIVFNYTSLIKITLLKFRTMKTRIVTPALALAAIVLSFASCKKENSNSGSTTASGNLSGIIASLEAVGVGTTSSTSSSQSDSIYIVNTCERNEHRDSIAFNSLPASITNYLNTNYSGYAFIKAFTVKDNSGTIKGYVVVIRYNGKPVGLKFDASGNFIKVLEQREGRDLAGNGWHEGGQFDDRDDRGRDTISLNSLPQVILTYFTAHYPSDTLVKAIYGKDSSYIILSKNNGAFVTVFNAQGGFVSRVQLPSPQDAHLNPIDKGALPSSILNYLSATYPGYTFKQAFSATLNGTLKGYVVFINANNTRYAIEFDASGTFVKAITIH